MKINYKQFKKWMAALDSGKFKQTKRKLNDSYGFCCLGVACKVLIKEEKILRGHDGFIYGEKPEKQPASPRWLKNINDDFLDKTEEPLVWVNDGMDFTFPEIATLLELVYIHKALN